MAVDFNAQPSQGAADRIAKLERFRQQRREKEAQRVAEPPAAVVSAPVVTVTEPDGFAHQDRPRAPEVATPLVTQPHDRAAGEQAASAAGRGSRDERRGEIASHGHALEAEQARQFLSGDRDVVAELARARASFTPKLKDRQR